jgi:hypothetical protein
MLAEIEPGCDIWSETRVFKDDLSSSPQSIIDVSRFLPNAGNFKAGESATLPLATCFLESGERAVRVLLVYESVCQIENDWRSIDFI